MISLVIGLFWCASLLVIYPYVGYPVIVYLLGRYRPLRRSYTPNNHYLPTVTLLVSAHNEEAVIRAKVANALALDYPPDRLEILVVSDASSDRTDQIVTELSAAHRCVRLLRQDVRRGKSAGINEGVAAARGEVIVFSDANAMYDGHAVRRLVAPMSDDRVGYVVGAALYRDAEGSRAAESEGLYWRLELLLKEMESRFHSVVGGDGAIYAARRELLTPLQDDDISDFVAPLQIVARGYLGEFAPEARCYERASESFAKEFGRKRRIVNRSWRAFRRYGRLLSPTRHGRFIFMLFSHKVIRWFGLPLIGAAWLLNMLLLPRGYAYVMTWLLITVSALIALYGALLDRRGRRQPRLVSLFHYFYVVNLAGTLGVWDEWRGVRHVVWNHIRNPQPPHV